MNENPSIENPSQSKSSAYRIGVLLALAGTLLFSIKPVLVKVAYQYGGDVTSIMALRALTSLPFYLYILVHMCRSSENRQNVRQHGLLAVAVGILGYFFATYLDIVALEYISAQLERLLIFLFPTFVVLISWVLYKQKPNRKVVSATIIGYVGIAFVVAHDLTSLGEDVLYGSGLAILSAIAFAFYLVWSKPLIAKLGSPLFTSIGMGSAGVAILIHLAFSNADIASWSIELIAIGALLGLFCTVIPSYLIAAAMARISPTELSLSSNIGPSITAVAAVTILGEAFTWFHLIGMALVVFSVYQINRSK
ncbi:DMT family transporter [Vibrio paucivorans]